MPPSRQTVLVADIVGFTSITAGLNREGLLGLLDEFRDAVAGAVAEGGGRIIKFIGDAALVLFEDAESAAQTGFALLDRIEARRADPGSIPIFEIRVVLHSGEVTMTEDDIFGETVNVTFRIEETAEGGALFISESTRAVLARDRWESVETGTHQFKGLRDPIRVFRLERSIAAPETSGRRARRAPTEFDLSVSRGEVVAHRLELQERLRIGTLGPVYLAYDREARARRAIHLIEPFRPWTPVETRDRCREILDRLVRLEHSCLIRCHEYGIAFGALFVAADFVAEPRLADRLAAGTRFEPRAAARLLREIAGGIEACHAIGLRHGEIAPHNIALFDGRAKLLDAGHFDLARIIGRGSPWAHDYIAPEEADGGSAEARSDLYALGVLAFELATGEKPFIESNIRKLIERHRFSPPPLPRTRRPGLVRAWDDLVQGLMAKDPDKRPTLIEVKRLFEELTHADPPPPEPDKVDLAVLGERLHERARDLFELGRFDEARAPLAELLEKVETQHARGWNLLGVIELKAKRREAAARHFARALAIDCEYLEAAMNLGLACQESRRFEEAARAYAEAARIKPGQARAWLHLGECRLALKQYPTAMASWEKALQLEPGNATLRERLASLKKALG